MHAYHSTRNGWKCSLAASPILRGKVGVRKRMGLAAGLGGGCAEHILCSGQGQEGVLT